MGITRSYHFSDIRCGNTIHIVAVFYSVYTEGKTVKEQENFFTYNENNERIEKKEVYYLGEDSATTAYEYETVTVKEHASR